MRAWQIAVGTVIFQLSIPVTTMLGVAGPVSFSAPDIISMGLSDWHTYIAWSAIAAGGLAAKALSLRVPIGALVFAGVFGVSNIGMQGILGQLVASGFLPTEIKTLLTGVITVVFLFAFIQLASTGGKSSY